MSNYHTPTYQLTRPEARELFEYKNGELYRKHKIRGHKEGTPAGYRIYSTGYYTVQVEYVKMQLHTVIWNYHFGLIPEGHCIDHINRNRGDNRIENLRVVTHQQNMLNRVKKKALVTGVTKQGDGWTARLMKNGEYILCKYFDNWTDAVCARKKAEQRYKEILV
jgi:hypothetical protein